MCINRKFVSFLLLYFYCVCLITVCRIYFLLPHKIGEIKLYINRPIVFARWRQYASLSKHSSLSSNESDPKPRLDRISRFGNAYHGYDQQRDRPTDRPRHSVCSNKPHLCYNKVSPSGRRDDMPPPMAVQSKNRGGPMSVRGHLWWPAVAKLQAASVPIV